MLQSNAGSFRLFRLFGIDVWLHWSWFVVAYLQFQVGGRQFNEPIWHIATYLSLFSIVLLHEFGHALACKSVGGHADRIVLWPLGGVAFVRPPPRPGAVLWSILAGPLVNVLLVPPSLAVLLLVLTLDPPANAALASDLKNYVVAVTAINLLLLVFNMLPIYPLDGGQILQAILWFFVGRATSLKVVAVIGLAAAIVGGGLALWHSNTWTVLLACFIGWRSYQGLLVARAMTAISSEQEGTGVP